MHCRGCKQILHHIVCDLGKTPLANSYKEDANRYPLAVYVCDRCFLVQLGEVVSPVELFSDYAYFSSYSDSWLRHAKAFAEESIQRFALDEKNLVVEIASNDGYLLQYFQQKGIPVLGVEPAENIAKVAREQGIPTEARFFGKGALNVRANLLIANNVLAHVPDLHDFIAGLKECLADGGVLSIEFPHLLQLIRQNQFDTIYHEHVFYFSLLALEPILQKQSLALFDVEELSTHGGSLRLYVKHEGDSTQPERPSVRALREKEVCLGQLETYHVFRERITSCREKILQFLVEAKREGKKVAAYGAPAKGSTLLNYCGIDQSLISFTVDRNPHKQGGRLPGSHIPIYPVEKIVADQPDYLVILPWNLKEEIVNQMGHIREWGGQFVLPIPGLEVI